MPILRKFLSAVKAARRIYREQGLRILAFKAARAALKPPLEVIEMQALLTNDLRRRHDNRVAYGPFSGMRLSDEAWWGGQHDSTKILGAYEAHIVDLLSELRAPEGLFVDIGSADGYFAVGCLRAGFFRKAICFEASEKGRASLKRNAAANGVAEQIEINGLASLESLRKTTEGEGSGVVLCDIESGEFALLTDEVLATLSAFTVIVELHAGFLQDGAAQRAQLIDRAKALFDVSIIGPRDPNPSEFEELAPLPDYLRLLAFSEGRRRRPEWMICRPRAN